MDPYDSDNSDENFKFPSQSIDPFNNSNYESYKRGQQFLIVDHTANQRKDSEVFKIWQHDGERRQVNDDLMNRYWRYNLCSNKRILKYLETDRKVISYPVRHLK